jgi:CHASE2 domain-containing sensor protein/tRNA A-37 threonylcarbamoyl transferase component Bud32
MAKPPVPPTTKTVTLTNTVPAKEATKSAKASRSAFLLAFKLSYLGHFLLLVWASIAALMTATSNHTAQFLERQAQTVMFRTRGPVVPPSNIVILGVNDQDPTADPKARTQTTLPIRRAVYGQVINQVMQAGAKTVALDLLLDLPSRYGESDPSAVDCVPTEQKLAVSDDDRQLVQVLRRYPQRIVLAADFVLPDDTLSATVPREGLQNQLILPYCPFRSVAQFGFISFPLEPIRPFKDIVKPASKSEIGQVHRLGSEANRNFKAATPAEAIIQTETLLSLAEATLKTAGSHYPQPQGEHIFFYGYPGTFEYIPFWKVLSPENLKVLLKEGAFKDKIVLIGSTKPGEDMLKTPFGDMPGVEIHANAIATLLNGKTLRHGLPDGATQGIFVLLIVLGAGVLQSLTKHPAHRFLGAGAMGLGWGSLCYLIFTQGLILPTALPLAAIMLSGCSYLVVGIAVDRRHSQQLRHEVARQNPQQIREMVRDEAVRETLLQQRELALFGKKLQDRYKIVKTLGSGGFGEAFIAEDLQRPGQPQCVVKQLCPVSSNPQRLKLAIKLFELEAQTLEKLGTHNQIPQLLAYFKEKDELYLVQEFIAGESLSSEVTTFGRRLPEVRVIEILKQLLNILDFVHRQGVIHRDIKPSNVIKRDADGQLVLIDFGAVKELHTKLQETDAPTNLTVGIGTVGYMPPEQRAGNPKFNSDLYALGMIGIQALTGVSPKDLQSDLTTNEVIWQTKVKVSQGLAKVLTQMIRYDYKARYQSAAEVLVDLNQLSDLLTFTQFEAVDQDYFAKPDPMTTTQPWPSQFAHQTPSEDE